MNNLTNQYQNYRNQLHGISDINSQIETIKNNIVSQHVQDWEDIKDKWDKATAIGEEASAILGNFRLGQKFKAGVTNKFNELKGKLSDKVEDIKSKGQDFIDSAQNKVDNVVDVATNKADGVLDQANDAYEKAQGTMADLTGGGNAVKSSEATLSDLQEVANQPDLGEFRTSPNDIGKVNPNMYESQEMGEVSTKQGITMEDLANQFPAGELERPEIMGSGKFKIGFSGDEDPNMGFAATERQLGTMPQRSLPSNPVGDMGGSGGSHSQPEEPSVSSDDLVADVGDFREKTLGLFGRLKAGLFSGKAPIQQELGFGKPQEIMSDIKSVTTDAGEALGKTATDIGGEVAGGLEEAGGEIAGDVAEGVGASILGSIPVVGEALGIGTAIAGLVGSFTSQAKEQAASLQNPLTKTNFSQFNVIPTMSSIASMPTTPGIF